MTSGAQPTRYVSFTDFLDDLAAVDWSVASHAHQRVETLLRRLDRDRSPIKELVKSWRPGGDRRITRDTSTHQKWFVHEDDHERFAIWLHVYKPAGVRGSRHAVIPHNHRYWFSSLMLTGGFTSRSFRTRGGNGGPTPDIGLSVRRGDVFTVAPDEVHALEAIEDRTITLIVQGRAVRNYSEVFEPDTGEVTRFYDTAGLLPDLRTRVMEL